MSGRYTNKLNVETFIQMKSMGHKGLHLIAWINRLCLAFVQLRGKTNLYDPLQTGLFLAF